MPVGAPPVPPTQSASSKGAGVETSGYSGGFVPGPAPVPAADETTAVSPLDPAWQPPAPAHPGPPASTFAPPAGTPYDLTPPAAVPAAPVAAPGAHAAPQAAVVDVAGASWAEPEVWEQQAAVTAADGVSVAESEAFAGAYLRGS